MPLKNGYDSLKQIHTFDSNHTFDSKNLKMVLVFILKYGFCSIAIPIETRSNVILNKIAGKFFISLVWLSSLGMSFFPLYICNITKTNSFQDSTTLSLKRKLSNLMQRTNENTK